VHQYVGVATLAAVAAFWSWSLIRERETPLGALLPWFSARRLHGLRSDTAKYLRGAMAGKLVDDQDSALAEEVHGLGLLGASLMTVTEATWLVAPGGTSVGHYALGVHKLFGSMMWAYLVLHAGLAGLHHALGSDILSRMFLPRGVAGK